MTTKLILSFTACLFFFTGFGQFTFKASPGMSMNSASFGYRFNRIVPFAGMQFYMASGQSLVESQDYDVNGNLVDQKDEYNFKMGMLMPNVGLKCFIKESGNVKAHLTMNVVKPFVFGKAEYNGDEDEDLEEFVKALSLIGAEFSFGAEYFFDEHFSLGGEFGLRYFHSSYHDMDDRTIWNPNTGEPQTVPATYDFKLNASPTFTRISLNFYF